MNIISNKTFDEERALYNLKDSTVTNCIFSGPADGESAFKEARNIKVESCRFDLRYPFWHVSGFEVTDAEMTETCRAALWYSEKGQIRNCKVHGVKALRECRDIHIEDTDIISTEFGWKCHNISISNSNLTSEYAFFETDDGKIRKLSMKGKYSFQYTSHFEITDSVLDTKDAFWHANDITVKDCTIRGEYLGWYSTDLKLIRCKIIGTQPLCYCKRLYLEDCTMEGCDLSFECSDVNASVFGKIDSVKNPKTGIITADSFGEILIDKPVYETDCKVLTR